ncbi:MAG: Na(+)/H(+) antiporter subunit B [Desulfobacterales bacterium]|jgi:multisubunit Na+/H+ antiporter MnhB subunit|nr:Na(+)/H(+) antiporter subunit B [Desulfobacterales bacterium]
MNGLDDTPAGDVMNASSPLLRRLAALAALAIGAGLAAAVGSLPEPPAALPRQVAAFLPASGVRNPVTAVLLNFRSLDTLLELAVLVLAATAARALSAPRSVAAALPPPDPVLAAFFRLFAPMALLVAGYLLWVGAHAPGGAFQAGSVLAATGVMAALTTRFAAFGASRWLPPALALGPAVFLAVGVAVAGGGRSFLQYPAASAGGLILLIESAAALCIAAALAALFLECLQGPLRGPAADPPGGPR